MNLIQTIKKIACRFTEDNITVYSAQAAFFVVVSIIPFFMLLISLLQFLIPDSGQVVLDTIVTLLPGTLGEVFQRALNELFYTSTSSVLSISTIVSLWAASKGIMGLEQGLHFMYRAEERENYFIRRLHCTLYTFLFLIAIILAFALLVMGETLQKFIGDSPTLVGQILRLLLDFRLLLAVVLFIITFTVGYRYLSGVRCGFLEALPGVLFTTLGWMVFSYVFSIYITYFSRYTYLYGSFGALILLFLWIYFCILILMIGAEINVYLLSRLYQ